MSNAFFFIVLSTTYFIHSHCSLLVPGPNSSILELADSIHAAEIAEKFESHLEESTYTKDEVPHIYTFC